MRKARKPEEQDPGAPAWMTTFGDLMSLLLTFFVLIVSMSSIQEAKFKVAMESFRRALSWFEGQPPSARLDLSRVRRGADKSKDEDPAVPTVEVTPIIAADDIVRIAREMQAKIEHASIAGRVLVYHNDREIRIHIPDYVIFTPGFAKLEGDGIFDLMDDIVALVKNIPYPLNIEGYTDDTHPSTYGSAFETNWELSSARALAVLSYLENAGISPKRLKAVAYGENRPGKPEAMQIPDTRWKSNRVEIVIRNANVE